MVAKCSSLHVVVVVDGSVVVVVVVRNVVIYFCTKFDISATLSLPFANYAQCTVHSAQFMGRIYSLCLVVWVD